MKLVNENNLEGLKGFNYVRMFLGGYTGNIQFGTYMELFRSGIIDPKPTYQRPYTYDDELGSYTGNTWQKNLISNFLRGDKIPPLSLRQVNDKPIDFQDYNQQYIELYVQELLDGGHRTRTFFNFYQGLLETPKGFTLEINGKSYDLGEMSWVEFPPVVKDYLSKTLVFDVDVYTTLTDTLAGEKFRTLNNLHVMTDPQWRNSYRKQISYSCRQLGSFDSSEFEIFTKRINGENKLLYLSSKVSHTGRVTDEIVSILSIRIKENFLSNIEPETYPSLTPSKTYIDNVYENDLHEKKGETGSYHINGKTINRVKKILSVMNRIIVNNSNDKRFKKINTLWTKSSLVKLGLMINDWIDKYGHFSMERMDESLFFNKLTSYLLTTVKELSMVENCRYEVVNGKLTIVHKKNMKSERSKYRFQGVWKTGININDYEWLKGVIETDMEKNLSNWGIVILDNQRDFTKKQRQEIEDRDGCVCKHDGCDVTENLHVDHIKPWSKGGKTHIDNGQLLCSEHNLKKTDTMDDEQLVDLSTEDLQGLVMMGKIDLDKVFEIQEIKKQRGIES